MKTRKTIAILLAVGVFLGLGVVLGASSASAAIVTPRHSTSFVSTIDQIEGDADPGTLSPWTDGGYGTPPVTINGDGTLTMVTPTSSYPAWGWNSPPEPSLISSSTGWTWETRFRIDAANVSNRGVWEIYMRDRDSGSLSGTRIHFLSTGIDRDASGYGVNAEVPADLTDDFHTIRGAVEAGTDLVTVWLDEVKVMDALPNVTWNADEFVRFGKWGGQARGGTTTIDYIRFDTTGAYAPGPPDVIPEPATMCALGLAVAGLGGYVRKRRKA